MTDAASPLHRADVGIIRERMRALHAELSATRTREDLRIGARHLGIPLRKNKLLLGNEAELTILSDYLNYSYRPRGCNAAELHLRAQGDTLDAFSRQLLKHMSEARYSILLVESIVGDGVLQVKDLPTDRSWHLLDTNLSRSIRTRPVHSRARAVLRRFFHPHRRRHPGRQEAAAVRHHDRGGAQRHGPALWRPDRPGAARQAR